MNQQPNQTILIEVTKAETVFDPSQTIPLIIHRDRHDDYHLSLEQLQKVRSKIIEVVRLGSNYRHPLLFDVQVIPGNKADSIIASVTKDDRRQRRQRRHN